MQKYNVKIKNGFLSRDERMMGLLYAVPDPSTPLRYARDDRECMLRIAPVEMTRVEIASGIIFDSEILRFTSFRSE